MMPIPFFFLDLMNSKMIARRARVKALKKAAKDAKRKNEVEFKVGVLECKSYEHVSHSLDQTIWVILKS